MQFLPTSHGTRPRLALELRPEGIVAAGAQDASAPLEAISRASLGEGALLPGLKPGNVALRSPVVTAIRQVLETVALNSGIRQTTLIVPDAAVRVLLLDFDSLPAKFAEALPVVRFRLKKMLPFDAEDAALSYQIMSSAKGLIRIVAAAMPREVLAEYESAVREAGFEPGAVLPSTLAALAGIEMTSTPTLLVNAGEKGITTAITQSGVLLLHRSVDMTTEDPYVEPEVSLPLVNRDQTATEWAFQEPVLVGVSAQAEAEAARGAVQAEPNAVLDGVREELRELASTSGSRELTQAVSVAVAYFEDTLGSAPGTILSAGTTGADLLASLLREAHFGGDGFRVREIVEPAMLATSSTSTMPRGWLAGVAGALRG